jgi:hypothetical protein
MSQAAAVRIPVEFSYRVVTIDLNALTASKSANHIVNILLNHVFSYADFELCSSEKDKMYGAGKAAVSAMGSVPFSQLQKRDALTANVRIEAAQVQAAELQIAQARAWVVEEDTPPSNPGSMATPSAPLSAALQVLSRRNRPKNINTENNPLSRTIKAHAQKQRRKQAKKQKGRKSSTPAVAKNRNSMCQSLTPVTDVEKAAAQKKQSRICFPTTPILSQAEILKR